MPRGATKKCVEAGYEGMARYEWYDEDPYAVRGKTADGRPVEIRLTREHLKHMLEQLDDLQEINYTSIRLFKRP